MILSRRCGTLYSSMITKYHTDVIVSRRRDLALTILVLRWDAVCILWILFFFFCKLRVSAYFLMSDGMIPTYYLLMSASGPATVFTEFSIICSLLGVHLVILLPEKHHTLTFWEDQYLVIHGAFCVNFATQKRPEQFLWVCSI